MKDSARNEDLMNEENDASEIHVEEDCDDPAVSGDSPEHRKRVTVSPLMTPKMPPVPGKTRGSRGHALKDTGG
jgi:hypothetical protein